MEGTPATVAGRPPLAGTFASPLVSRYLLRLLGRPLLATLMVVLPALLLERLLRLFDLVASSNGAIAPVIQLLVFLTPHYIGLALPAAFFISVFTVITRLSENHELDALQSSGLSLARLARPFLLVGVLLALAGIVIYGYLQPLGRYSYRAAFYAVTHAGWNATVGAGEFIRIGKNLAVSADVVDPRTGQLGGIFIEQKRPDGTQVTTTARTGWLTRQPAEGTLLLQLEAGRQISISPQGEVTTLQFGDSAITRPFSMTIDPFRFRGNDEREMTLGELWAATRRDGPPGPGEPDVPRRRLEGELNGRLVRSFSMALLPLLAIPMGLGAKRTRRWQGVALSAVILVIYHHAVQLAESLGDIGLINPAPALWGIFGLFALFSLMAFRHANRNPYEGPFDAVLQRLESMTSALGAWLPRRRPRASATERPVASSPGQSRP
ncbi:LptF/LptG family permease [Roseomonas marmotae]|uniref:LptF/LptG family permease n=1 Tax=Roseomonas marmotae TaxID=2768161 RepID=A0ABS3KFY0_9PROT|nr:LptF/LptG family permease [Roseomonas marmotae]MBO1075872.1 LptF/LptG family permease [Roseomonas marmotae]QTI81940.1 LptF/LptG family permease [Roseomonas marmotae]